MPEQDDKAANEKDKATHEPACASPVLAAGPEFRGDGQNQVRSKDQGPPGPVGAQDLQTERGGVCWAGPDWPSPEIVACRDPVEEGEHGNATEERCDTAETISNMAHKASLGPNVLYLTKLEGLRSLAFHYAPI